jgi:hypothetical protein
MTSADMSTRPSIAQPDHHNALTWRDRAGRLACFCPPASPTTGTLNRGALWRLCLGFAGAVLAQSLVTGLLPLAGLMLAPAPALINLPYMAMILGAAVATFPAAYLLDVFGRKASFALGASHGLAGGLILAWALAHHVFVLVCLGAFWLGIAQGFSLFYRHEAAVGQTRGQAAFSVIMVFGSGALAGIFGPALLLAVAQTTQSQYELILALVAALAQISVLALAVTTADASISSDAPAQAPPQFYSFWLPTIAAACAWFGMTQTMLAMPTAMQSCGIGLAGIFGVMAWHVLVMYAPAFAVYPLARWCGAAPLAVVGLILIILAHSAALYARDVIDFSLIVGALALGWSITTTASTLWLHHRASPPRSYLGLHDGLLFCAALCGAFFAGPLPLGLM